MNSQLLPDVNVWVAMHHQIHSHHQIVLEWFNALATECALVFCRQTQMGFFRLLTTDSVMGDEVLSQRQCWTLYHQWISGGKAKLRPEPEGAGQSFEQRTSKDAVSPKEWMDAYLAAFAEAGNLTLVTMDRALAAKAKGAVLLGES